MKFNKQSFIFFLIIMLLNVNKAEDQYWYWMRTFYLHWSHCGQIYKCYSISLCRLHELGYDFMLLIKMNEDYGDKGGWARNRSYILDLYIFKWMKNGNWIIPKSHLIWENCVSSSFPVQFLGIQILSSFCLLIETKIIWKTHNFTACSFVKLFSWPHSCMYSPQRSDNVQIKC